MLSAKLLLSKKNVLKPFEELDVLPYYSITAQKLKGFLKGKEIATKVYIPPKLQLLKRGSQLEPLFVEELGENVDEKFLQMRKMHLEEARGKISKTQEKIWQYFFPRKYCTFFYATNGESINKPIERIFYDIDRKETSTPEEARTIACELVQLIQADKEFNKKIGKFKMMPLWTGSSFHIYLLLEKSINHEFYDKELMYSKKDPLASFTGKWAQEIAKKTGLKVVGGHEKQEGFINIDPSQTPSGKLARAPFSLHFKDAKTLDGIALPLTIKQLCTKGIVKELQKATPEKVLKELNEWAKAIPA